MRKSYRSWHQGPRTPQAYQVLLPGGGLAHYPRELLSLVATKWGSSPCPPHLQRLTDTQTRCLLNAGAVLRGSEAALCPSVLLLRVRCVTGLWGSRVLLLAMQRTNTCSLEAWLEGSCRMLDGFREEKISLFSDRVSHSRRSSNR